MDAILSWGTGNSPKRVFPEAGDGLPLPFAVGGGVYWVAVALFAIAWVSFSTAFAARLPEGDSPAPRRVRIRLPASRGRRLAIVAVALVGTVGAVVLVAPTPWEGAAGPGPYPFANFPEFPVLQPSDLAGAEAILLAAVPELRGQAWQMLGATPATRGGAKFGVFAQVVGKDGGALTVLPEHLRGTCGAGEPGSSQGLTVMVDLDAGALVLLSPLGADPGCTNLR